MSAEDTKAIDTVDEEDDDEYDDEEFEEDYDDIDYEYDEDEEGEDRQQALCKARFLKGSPKKYRRVLWQIRGRSYREALMLLEFLPWRTCKPVLKCLQSAAANAQNTYNMDKSRLYISRCQAYKGPYSKRMRIESKGMAQMYKRWTTHLHIYVAELRDEELEDFA
ncbi:unnamed protein product [Prorocentrum cordatum]|uniref:Large ribosomal subunit protein uL22c n=1 Tax=Prorocentrum cordatum TaxID=2364126 RepID=A0ABN9THP0_9DINO|nr:unnamed protein product [Polarella glacialis]